MFASRGRVPALGGVAVHGPAVAGPAEGGAPGAVLSGQYAIGAVLAVYGEAGGGVQVTRISPQVRVVGDAAGRTDFGRGAGPVPLVEGGQGDEQPNVGGGRASRHRGRVRAIGVLWWFLVSVGLQSVFVGDVAVGGCRAGLLDGAHHLEAYARVLDEAKEALERLRTLVGAALLEAVDAAAPAVLVAGVRYAAAGAAVGIRARVSIAAMQTAAALNAISVDSGTGSGVASVLVVGAGTGAVRPVRV